MRAQFRVPRPASGSVSVARSDRQGQLGLTLLEVLVTIGIMAGGMVGIASGLAAAERIAGINQSQAQLEVTMRQFTDWVRNSSSASCTGGAGGCPSLPYTNCAGTAVYQTDVGLAKTAGALTPGTGVSLTVKQVSLSTGATRTSGANSVSVPPVATCSGTCNPPPGVSCVGDWGAQEITLQVAGGGNTLSRTVWKSSAW